MTITYDLRTPLPPCEQTYTTEILTSGYKNNSLLPCSCLDTNKSFKILHNLYSFSDLNVSFLVPPERDNQKNLTKNTVFDFN